MSESGDVARINEMNDAIATGNVSERLLHPDVVWEHNLGVGSPEEGVYRGRESVVRLFERIVETWHHLRPVSNEIRELEKGKYLVKGELHAKHRTSDTEIVTPYEQTLELRDGLLAKAAMVTGALGESGGKQPARDSENVALIRRFIDAFNRLDVDSAVAMLDPEVELHEWPAAPGARTYHGHEGVRRALDSWFEVWQWMEVEIKDIVDLDDRVLFALHQRAKGKGSAIEVEIDTFNVYTFRDGKVVRIELFTERDPAIAAAGLATNRDQEER